MRIRDGTRHCEARARSSSEVRRPAGWCATRPSRIQGRLAAPGLQAPRTFPLRQTRRLIQGRGSSCFSGWSGEAFVCRVASDPRVSPAEKPATSSLAGTRKDRHEAIHTLRPATIALLVALVAAVSLVAGCSGSGTSAAETTPTVTGQAHNFPVTITDDAKRTITVNKRPERIVSLAPANTEIVAALGLEDKLVGVTSYCDYPPSVKSLPRSATS